MKKVLLFPLALLGLCVAGVLLSQLFSPSTDAPDAPRPKQQPLPTPEIKTASAPVAGYFKLDGSQAIDHQRLTLYPIVAGDRYVADFATIGNYLTLKDGLASGEVSVTERGTNGSESMESTPLAPQGGIALPPMYRDQAAGEAYEDGASVNTLLIENNSNDTLYLMAGDVVQGGLQDRVLAQDLLIAPKSGQHAVPVFCVESNRWHARDADSRPASKPSSQPIYAFSGYFNVASNSVRYAASFEGNQSEVWANVGHVTDRNGAASSTHAYTALAGSARYNEACKTYFDALSAGFADERVVGVLVAVEGKVIACDMFAHPALFAQQFPLLLHGYVTDAVTLPSKSLQRCHAPDVYFQQEVVAKYFANQKDTHIEHALKYVHRNRIIHFKNIEGNML